MAVPYKILSSYHAVITNLLLVLSNTHCAYLAMNLITTSIFHQFSLT